MATIETAGLDINRLATPGTDSCQAACYCMAWQAATRGRETASPGNSKNGERTLPRMNFSVYVGHVSILIFKSFVAGR